MQHKKGISYLDKAALGIIPQAKSERKHTKNLQHVGTNEVGPKGEITAIPHTSMVAKYLIFDENNPDFRWPMKGEEIKVVQNSRLEPKYKMFNEHDPNFTWPLKH